jgi:prepilin-type N-terminal cleavage/methylation domain-containing protein
MGENMTKRHQPKGFTLVELAISMVIIGLLIGGMLKGYKVIEQARVTATVTQVAAIDGAAKTFYDTYSYLPGDLINADTHLPDCGSCIVTAAAIPPASSPADGAGNGVIGNKNWNMAVFQSQSPPAVAGSPEYETVLFWLELSRAGLISGITDDGINSIAASFGGSLPAAKIGGGFLVGYASNNGPAAMPGRSGFTTSRNDIPQRGDDGFFIASAHARSTTTFVDTSVVGTTDTSATTTQTLDSSTSVSGTFSAGTVDTGVVGTSSTGTVDTGVVGTSSTGTIGTFTGTTGTDTGIVGVGVGQIGVISSSSSSPAPPPGPAFNMRVGTVLALARSTTDLTDTVGANVVSPVIARQMDVKLDNGKADSGYVQSYGPNECHGDYTATNEESCGLYFRILR